MNKKRTQLAVFFLIFLMTTLLHSSTDPSAQLPGFSTSSYFDEQVVTFKLYPGMRIHINAPSADSFDVTKPVGLALFALPNGNTIEQTVGKVLQPGDDWHYDIQHIGAQTRFLRGKITDYNLVIVYLEAKQKSWPTWNSEYPNSAAIIKETVEYLKSYFRDYDPFVILTGHSGGGRFIFSFLDAFTAIPDYVDRICFLDSNYGYENHYGDKMINWLDASPDHFISVLAYNDSVALYNGQPIVSATGGTWYRSRMMQRYFSNFYTFETSEDDEFIRHSTLDGRVKILLKKNPDSIILHTVQVERNGFIHTMLTGTPLESSGYEYYGERAYTSLVQAEELPTPNFQIPLRSPNAKTGAEFMQSVINMTFSQREEAILNELLTGNLPYFYRQLKEFSATFNDANGAAHQVNYRVMPDYLAIGSESDFCRIPMGPITAQKIGDFYGACMPTRKLVDDIYQNAEIKLAPVTYTPVGNQNESVEKFIEHNTAIENQFAAAGGVPGQLVGGTKKDVVLSNIITDPARPNHVVIYGWHQLNGQPIQPLTNIHINSYVDYSHGIRLLDSEVTVDGVKKQVKTILKDANLYKLLSDETGPMAQPTYISDGSLPARPSSFGVKYDGDNKLKIVIKADAAVDVYHLYVSDDGVSFDESVTFTGNEYVLEGLAADSIVYVKLRAENTAGFSAESEALAGLPGVSDRENMLVVNGFDRTSAGNTYNFIRQHADAIVANGAAFESATNDAVLDGLFNLLNYSVVDYILGEESTVDETFSDNEQGLVAAFLKNGGRLFVSGAEIAWDLGYKGSSTDKDFLHDYLKVSYSADAPGGVPGTNYSAEGVSGGLFDNIDPITYDNGTHGTFDVKYADALTATNGSIAEIQYKNVTTHNIGGISFEGMFRNGTEAGKLVYLGFPFETIYPESTRHLMMERVFNFLYSNVTSAKDKTAAVPAEFLLKQNYPNPFNPTTTIEYHLPETTDVHLTIYNISGETVREWSAPNQLAGIHRLQWNGDNQAGNRVCSGTYIYKLFAGEQQQTRRMILMK